MPISCERGIAAKPAKNLNNLDAGQSGMCVELPNCADIPQIPKDGAGADEAGGTRDEVRRQLAKGGAEPSTAAAACLQGMGTIII